MSLFRQLPPSDRSAWFIGALIASVALVTLVGVRAWWRARDEGRRADPGGAMLLPSVHASRDA